MNSTRIICSVADNNGVVITDGVTAAIYHSISLGVHIMNMSFGTPTDFPNILFAIGEAHNADILTVAAAGNNQSGVEYPAKYSASFSSVIAVSATNHNDIFSAYSTK